MKSFKKQDWEFERSSGYGGYRNKHTGEWIYENEYNKFIKILEDEKFRFIIQEVMNWERDLTHRQRTEISYNAAKKEKLNEYELKFKRFYERTK
tara:strand:- start:1416 stop:1697 length:282 start_codon:yes stop_codon:yes gene_type:complete